MKNTGLGKGLGALLGDAAHQTAENDALFIRISQIEPNADQPRKSFDEEALTDLSESIRTHGVLTPLLVRRLPSGSYQIIAGERRWRAARMAGLNKLPAIVREADDRLATELALIENLQREDLNPVEIADGYRALVEEYGLTQEEVAARVGRSRPAVANTMRLLALPSSILIMLSEGRLTEGHARSLLSLPKRRQEEAALKMADGAMTVRQAEAFVKTLTENEGEQKQKTINYVAEHEKNLSDHWGRKINIIPGRKKGRVEIEFYDADDLETLVDRLLK